ncbi:hypothetical protein D8674_010374 [Pyrus ussuriensis x Pyrus communis]|uniref:Retrovirus-related Pol polyprotein from transposon TNT 1-94-like beta-barrel domain-containing protein n=1 Tax=Pyrus ussuriensis x Pyrus communis TaxID=2448454 RepID=A0A5N5FB97_9ROSA|nr:hypothetical protein D8674_010374 [Pyrus ussuriensis x Pyrus communis]
MEKLECVVDEFYGYKYVNNDEVATKVTLFPALKSLSFIYCPSLGEWKEAVVVKEMSTGEKVALIVFPRLEMLDVQNYAQLRSAPTHFPSLRELDIWNVDNAMPIETTLTLEYLSIQECCNLEVLPSLDNVTFPNLKTFRELTIVDCPKLRCTSIHSLPSPRYLFIRRCKSLELRKRRRTSTTLQEEEEEEEKDDLSLNGCTSLRELRIEECNGFTSTLSGLLSCTSLRKLHIAHCQNLRTLSGHGLQTPVSLKDMDIRYCPNLKAIPSLDHLTSLLQLNLQYFPTGLQSLSRLEQLSIGAFCEKLNSFPYFQVPSKLEELELYAWRKLKSLPHQIQHSTSLTCLSICHFAGVEALPECLGNLTSLTVLKICECKNLRYLPTVKAKQRLTKLHDLKIESCSPLAIRCERISSLEWRKISHIPHITDLWERLRTILNNNNNNQQTTLQMKGSNSSSELKALVFDGENYDFWRIRMTTIFKSYDLWDMVQYGNELPEMEVDALEEDLTETQLKRLKQYRMEDARALGIIQGVVSNTIFLRIANEESAKELGKFYNKSTEETPKLERLFDVVNKMKTYGEELPNERIVQKLLISLTKPYDSIVSVIEETKDTETLSVQDVMASLRAFDQRLDRHADFALEKAFQSLNVGSSSQASASKQKPQWKGKNKKWEGKGYQNPKPKQGIYSNEVNCANQVEQEAIVFCAFSAKVEKNYEVWYIDSGCSNHMTAHESLLIDIDTNFTRKVKKGDGNIVKDIGKGTLVINPKKGRKCIREVMLIYDDRSLSNLVTNVEVKNRTFPLMLKYLEEVKGKQV